MSRGHWGTKEKGEEEGRRFTYGRFSQWVDDRRMG